MGNTEMAYITFGSGHENFIMIPGLGDGLKTVRGTAAVMAMLYREFGKSYKVYVFSRKDKLEEKTSTRDMAKDQRRAMEQLGIAKAHILGISQGGMIAQWLAIDSPDVVDKLMLAVTSPRPNETLDRVISSWIELAKGKDYRGLLGDTIEKSYMEAYQKKYRRLYPLLARIAKPKDFTRFILQAQAILAHNAYDELAKIKGPTLILGANQDEIVGAQASREIAEKIAGSKLLMYDGYGHGVYEEAKDFQQQLFAFLQAEQPSLAVK